MMGHNVRACIGDKEIARQNFGATNYIQASYLYKILDAEDFNNGVSGNGLNKIYSFENIKAAKAALRYYAMEPFEIVRNRQKEEQAESFIKAIIGEDAGNHISSNESVSDAIAVINTFLDQILNSKPLTGVEINFG